MAEKQGKTEKKEIRISVRNLVEFLLRSGDIDHRRGQISDREAMQAGSRIHRKIQKKRGASYQAEVSLKFEKESEKFRLLVEGRADGIFELSDAVYIEEIKGVYADPGQLKEPVAVHLAQAKCYAAIYGRQQECKNIRIRMTYVQLESEEEVRFESEFDREVLNGWFEDLISEYEKWVTFQVEWEEERDRSMECLEFPFAYRAGQRDLVVYTYRTIQRGQQMFAQAPTGIGKTISTVFPAVRTVGEGAAEKIFYLTAKTITRTVAEEAFDVLRGHGLCFRSLTVTAKEKICVCDSPECDPEHCARAKGHFDRVNDAIFSYLHEERSFTRESILSCAEKWNLCPYEFQMNLSEFMDAVICDYNYVFDPSARLKQYFSENAKKGKYVFLIDEAHNLVERGREMFSADLTEQELGSAIGAVRKEKKKHGKSKKVDAQLEFVFSDLSEQYLIQDPNTSELQGKEEEPELLQGETMRSDRSGNGNVRLLQKLERSLRSCRRTLKAWKEDCSGCQILPYLGDFSEQLFRLQLVMEELYEQKELEELREELLEFYFRLLHFTETEELIDENYLIYKRRTEEQDLELRLYCVNPAVNLQNCLNRGISTVFFSATLLPMRYYMQMLTTKTDNYAVYIPSPFAAEKRLLKMAVDVSSRYTRRTHEEYVKITAYIAAVTAARKGNYLIFFPSYAFMEQVYELYMHGFADGEETECILQTSSMREADKEAFLDTFTEEPDKTRIGFCVMGGIFSEGIDLKGERLIGVLVIGTGIPQISPERELLKNYFDEHGKNGFDYAYRYPGMNKVLQAAGRVIRTEADEGVIVLLDERFRERKSQELFPREWSDITPTNINDIRKEMEEFWKIHR